MKKVPPQRIQIHYFKHFGKRERKAILSAFEEYVPGAYVALLSIDDSHSLRFYDSRTPDGSFPRRSYVYLSEGELLLSTTGYSPLGRQIGTPVLLKIRCEQHPTEFLYPEQVAKQVLGLTKLNWRSSRPFARRPVSLLFARRIAYLTGLMSEVTWNELISPEINPVLREKPWFL